jgi:S-DNA-T family DNA segregation ATPase FtsK/SpoIIIE
MDVIKCPDAVTLKNPGRFYLQVGYNDYFAMG